MSALNIHTGPGGLMAVEAAASANSLDAYFYTFTKAQRAARAADPDPTSAAYFRVFVQSLGTLGWTAVPGPSVKHLPGPVDLTPLQACANAVIAAARRAAPALPVPQEPVTQITEMLSAALGNASQIVSDQLDAWWSGAVSVENRTFAIGPIYEIFQTPIIPAVRLDIALGATSWRSLIEPASTFGFSVTPVLLALQWAPYNRLKQALHDELAETLADHVRTATVDLGPPRAAVP